MSNIPQEQVLLLVAKIYTSKHGHLPGVRRDERYPQSAGGVTAYQQTRQQLLDRYALKWLAAYHDLDAGLYASLLYDHARSAGLDETGVDGNDLEHGSPRHIAEVALDCLLAMADVGLTFDCTLDLLTAWLDDVTTEVSTVIHVIWFSW